MESPQQIGRYEVVAPLAVGGMGQLLLARERGPAGFERLVVVKLIRPQVADNAAIVEAFLREARLVARLNHPNIVQIIELGELEAGDYFIAMEYIEGSTVEELQVLTQRSGGRVPLDVVVSIAVQSCRGLEVAHDLRDADGTHVGLIHRDVSPQNLMCTTRGFVKLLDFGIAKTTVGGETTESGALKGKPGYFSPEQAQARALDRRTDIFSLGAVIWELVAGEPLFQAGGAFGTLRAVLDKPIPSLTKFGADEALDAIVQRALTRDREQRYPDASAFRAALSEYATKRGWPDVHDSLSAFVGGAAGDLVERRQDTANVARTRELSPSEGRSLVHLRAVPTLVDVPATVDMSPQQLADVTAEDQKAAVSLDGETTPFRRDDERDETPR
ncbi:MAG TPA: serine/threonine-protein kinase, partial [Gammaproteobacteria bacterium]|nr:serine/threonine-protein kinase [Gammaproteobacteria bacterium]